MPLNLGDKTINIPFSKVYLGSVLKYQKIKNVYFNACPFPTVWTQISSMEYTATNEYGEWKIHTNIEPYSTDYNLHLCVDNNSSSYYRPEDMGLNDELTVTVEFPCLIKPSAIYAKCYAFSSNAVIEGCDETGNWETLMESFVPSRIDTYDQTQTITPNKFYTKYRIRSKRFNPSYNKLRLYEFQITSGEIKN